MSFLEPVLSPLAGVSHAIGTGLGSILPSSFGFTQPSVQPFQPNLPKAQRAFVNKYNQLQPYLGSVPTPVRNSLINFDINRVNRGQNPLPLNDSVLALKAAMSGQAQTLSPTPSAKNFWGNTVRDVGQLVTAIPRIPFALLHEGKAIVEDSPAAVAKAFSSGNPLEVIHNLAAVPGIRDIPGAYVVGGLTGGRQGLEQLATHPVFTALDLLPFAQKAAAGTDLVQAQEALRNNLLSEGKFAPEIRPIRTVLTKTLDDAGNVIPNRLGRATEVLRQTSPGRFVSDAFSQEARQAAKLEGQANINYKQEISPGGLASTDPLVVATRDALEAQQKFGLDNERVAYLMRQDQLGELGTDPTITPTDRAYLDDVKQAQAKIRDYKLDNDFGQMFRDEFYDVPTATKLRAAESKFTNAQAKVLNDVIPKLQTTFDNYGDPRIQSLIQTLQSGDYGEATRIANGLYRGKTRLDRPQAVALGRNIKASEVAPADATLAAITNVRGKIRELVRAEKKFNKGMAANPPARFQSLIGQRAAEQYATKLASGGEQLAPVDADIAGQLTEAILNRDKIDIPGFNEKEFRDTVADVSRTWQEMRDVEGLNPAFYHRVTPSKFQAAQYRGVSDVIPKVSSAEKRIADISPSLNNIGASISHEGMELLQRRATETYMEQVKRAFGVDEDTLRQQLTPEARIIQQYHPERDMPTIMKELMNRTHSQLDDGTWVSATVKSNLDRVRDPKFYRLSSVTAPLTNTFRTSVLPLSPRWHVYNILGGGIMTAAASGLGAFKYVSEARQLLRDLSSEDPAVVLAAQERLPRELVLSLGGQTREAAELNFQAAKTMHRLWEEVGQTSPVAQRFKAMATKASGGLKQVTDRSFELNQLFDDTYRVMGYLNDYDKNVGKRGLAESAAQKEAISTARKIMHQWDEYTPIERQILRQVFPFYGFTQHIMRFAFKYPFDHPIRADLLSSFARNELEDQGSGLPAAFQNSMFFGKEDSQGHKKAVSLSGLNPFRDVANMMTLAGWASATTPIVSTVLEQLGIRNGQAELYPNLRYDPNTGQLTATHDNILINLLHNTIPQSQILTALIGASNEYKGLLAADPAAARRALIAAGGIPVLVRDYDLPKEYIKAETKRQDAENQARSDAYKSGYYGYAEQFPGLKGLANQVAVLQGQGKLAPLQPANAAQTNPAYAQQVATLTGNR